jgi:adenylyltransferase/sulfurtransferase
MSKFKGSRTKIVLGYDFEKLKEKRVAVVGVGGTGCIVASLLSRLPLKELLLVDGDVVEECNLERQILYYPSDLYQKKVLVASEKLSVLGNVIGSDVFFKEDSKEMVKGYDLIIDCTDNMEARKAIKLASDEYNIPWIMTGDVANRGQIVFIKPNQDVSKLIENKENEFCRDVGVINAAPNIIGGWVVDMAIMYLANQKIPDTLLRFNFDKNKMDSFTF